MAITIQNLRLVPYDQKNELKCVWGDTLTLTFTIPHVAGESYVCGMDNERVVYPPSRPVCAYTNVFTRDGDNVTFSLPLNTSKFRSYVSTIRKPMPVWLQVCRVGIDGKCETLVLDDILAIPSVLDATNTVCPGDPLKQLLENKMDKPAAAGTEGQVLTMDADGHYAWADLPHIPEDPVQSDWDESDSSNLSYIKNKPAISKVGHTGEYDDLLDKPDLKPVATSGSYNDLTDKPHIPVDPVQADYDESDSTALSYIKHKPDLSVYSLVTETGNSISMSIDADYDLVVSLLDKAGNTLSTQDIDLPIESMIVDATYANGVLTLTLQNGNTVDVDISDIVSGLVPDSRKVNGHALSADVTISYNDLTDKPVIPAAQVQSDWDESDSQAVDFIKGKPVLAAVATTGSYNSLSNRPAIPNFTGDWFGIWHDQADSTATTVTLSISGTNARANTFQYCTNVNTNNWADYTLGTALTLGQYQYVLWRNKDAAKLLGNNTGHYVFSITGGGVYLAGNLMTLKDKGGQYNGTASAYEFYQMFSGCTAIKDASMLRIPAAVISAQSCYGMFSGCTGMVRGPEVLPATVLGAQCYRFMFQDCTSLVKAPDLPATSLESMCYHSMFKNCTSLTEAPDLPAASVPSLAYNFMFQGCTALKHVRTAATALGTDYSQSWLYGVSETGVIECPAALDLSTRGADTAPAGWTIVRTDQPHADWDESDSTEASYIRNKPAISGGGSDNTDYLCFTCGQANSSVRLDKVGSAPAITLEYSTDRQTWTNYTWSSNTGETITLAAAGDRVWFRGDNTNGLGATNHNNYHQFVMTGKIYASGNLTSLIDKTCARMDVPAYCYQYLFQSCTSLLTPPKLPALELATHCYGNMFNGSGIIIPPELPAMTVPYEAYSGMFGQCTSLTTSPELPATTVGQKAYYYMFHRCSTIRIGPTVLPAKTLSNECYRSMFDICDNFVRAPYIMATDASANWCFYNMFYRCPNLHYVRIEATSLAQASGWFTSAAATGVFECPSALSITTRGASTVPAGWTIIRSDAPWSDFAQTDATEGAYVKNRGISATSASSDATYTVAAGSPSTGVLTVASTLTLSAGTVANTSIAYADLVINLAEGATVTAGTNITFKDEPVDGCRNICVVRWQDGSATLYVVDTIELS